MVKIQRLFAKTNLKIPVCRTVQRPRRDLFGHTGGVPVICFCRVISAARWMRPPANRTMKCCGGGSRDSGLPTRRERAKSGFEGVFMNRKRWPILCAIALFAVAILVYANFQKKHTFVLANDEGMIKSEQIQPLFGTVKVSGDCDTDVVFTDMETGEKYVVGYITSGVSEKIKLEKGKWYTVAGGGNLVISPVNVRVE